MIPLEALKPEEDMFSEALDRYKEALKQYRKEISEKKDPKQKAKLLKAFSDYEVKAIRELVEWAEEDDIPDIQQAANWTGRGESIDLLLNQLLSKKFGKKIVKIEKVESCPKCKVRLINDEDHECRINP